MMESMVSLTPATDPEVEVSSKAKRRVFTAKYKAKILREADACAGKRGAMGALLRREGLYSSHLTSWRRGVQVALESKKRGPKAQRAHSSSPSSLIASAMRLVAVRSRPVTWFLVSPNFSAISACESSQ